MNPVTGQPYAPNVVPRGDFTRVLAEFWADGPKSETPPGHWNTLANTVSDDIVEHRLWGEGDPVSRLEWDVKIYLALNGRCTTRPSRPGASSASTWAPGRITLIRFKAELGQSSDPRCPATTWTVCRWSRARSS
jgi:hypothetical protein